MATRAQEYHRAASVVVLGGLERGLRAARARTTTVTRSLTHPVHLCARHVNRQAVHNLLRLGLEHVLLMSASGPDCVRVAGAVPSAGCVWLDFELPVFGADSAAVPIAAPMWHNRCGLARRGGWPDGGWGAWGMGWSCGGWRVWREWRERAALWAEAHWWRVTVSQVMHSAADTTRAVP